jgi:endo-1,3(4)-beta-glucanase
MPAATDSHGFCNNTFPDCPALIDVNENFGNGFYNDHHFHYGYHIYAAAVAAKFDPAWGRKMFDRIMLYVRDIANPTPDDPYFPMFRQKDWFLGSSWASGIISMNTAHGRNQESSSEAIAAYEAVALFGAAMAEAFQATSEGTRVKDAEKIREAGRLLTAMEVSATQRYWHVWNSTTHENTYPAGYKQPVVGMLYETMASFQTWFAGGDMASIGIQLLPFTAVSERRDDPEWAALVYPPYEESCLANHDFCVENGWSVLLCGLKATIGDREGALKDVLDIPVKVFKSDGGNGHTRSNLIWYVSTRPDVDLKTDKVETIAEENGAL